MPVGQNYERWQHCVGILCLYCMATVPMKIAFEGSASGDFLRSEGAWHGFEIFISAMLFLDILVESNTAVKLVRAFVFTSFIMHLLKSCVSLHNSSPLPRSFNDMKCEGWSFSRSISSIYSFSILLLPFLLN